MARPMARSASTPTPSTAAPSSGWRAPSATSRRPASPSPSTCACVPAARAAASPRASQRCRPPTRWRRAIASCVACRRHCACWARARPTPSSWRGRCPPASQPRSACPRATRSSPPTARRPTPCGRPTPRSSREPIALRRRRPLAHLPRLPRGRLPLDIEGRAEPRGADPEHDALEAHPRGAARLPRHRTGSAGPDVPRHDVRRLQGDPDGDAGRPGAPAALRPPPVRRAPHAGPRGVGLRGRRHAGHARRARAGRARPRRRHRHRRQGPAAARRPARARAVRARAHGERIVYDEAKVRERWGVGPEQIPDVMALMGDSIDNIPGVKGVGEKTAVKLIAQYGSVERLYDNLTLIPGKLRETLALGRKQALLSRELATVSRSVPLAFDLEAFRRVEPDWTRLRALWMEMEFTRLVKELPAPPPAADAGPVEVLPDPARLGEWTARVPAGAGLTLDWAGDPRPPAPRIDALGLFHPDAGAAAASLGRASFPAAFPPGAPVLDGRRLVAHDAKPLLAAWMEAGAPPPTVDDTAVAAYLLNPARATYRLDEVCMEVFGECPQALTSVAPADLPRAVGDRARWLHRFWQHAHKDLDERGLLHIYEEIERPLVPVLAEMERVGIRVDPARLEAFAKELERNLDNLTREIHNLAGEEFTIASPKQPPQILFEKLKLPALRRTKTG